MTEYNYIQDPGHGWIQVPLEEIPGDMVISPFSYTDGDYAYLEEDLDAGTFLKHIGEENCELVTIHHYGQSWVRNLRSFQQNWSEK